MMGKVDGGIEFDRDAGTRKHLNQHRVRPKEFEELMSSDPVWLEYQVPVQDLDLTARLNAVGVALQ